MIIQTTLPDLRLQYRNKMVVNYETYSDIYVSVDDVLKTARDYLNRAFDEFQGLEDAELAELYSEKQANQLAEFAEKWFGYAQEVMRNGFYRTHKTIPAALVNTVTGN